MTTYTWKNGIGADWTITADWNPTGFPDATDAAAIISAAGSYTVTIGAGETQIVNSFTIGNNVLGGGAATPTLEVAGTLDLAGTSATSAFLQGALLIDSTGVIEGAGALGATSLNGIPFSFINNGTVLANTGANNDLFVESAFTNNGTLLATGGGVFVEGPSFSNFSNGTLTGGSYIVQGPSSGSYNQIGFAINGAATDLTTDAANIVLDGSASRVLGYDGSAFQPLENQLKTIASSGSLQLLDGRGYISSNALSDGGLLELQGGSLATGGLTVGSGGLFQGFGVVSGSVSDSGTIYANGGALYIPGSITGGGLLSTAAGSTLILAGSSPAAVTNNGIIYDSAGLLDINALTGSGTLAVQSGGTIELAAATSETIEFSGTNAHVTLGTPLLYNGTLVGFAQGDTLVLDGLSASSATIVNNNTLAVISGGSTVDTIALAGSYSGATFSASTVGGNAVITNLSGAPARDDMPFTISVNNSTTITGAQQTAIINDLSAAALDWAQYVTGHAPLRIQLNITNSGGGGAELANGGFASSTSTSQVINGETIFIPSSIYALTTGNYLPGTTADIIVNLPLSSGELDNPGGLYAAPNPITSGDTVPGNEFDLLTVFRHEMAHGLGFSGFTSQSGSLGVDATLFDSYIQDTVINGTITAANFIGPDAEAAYGAFLGTNSATPVPLTLLNNGENFFHVANSSGDPLASDLMSGLGLAAGQSRDISSVDLAMLQDVGLAVTADVMCFLRGTHIATPEGEVPVERLAVGDLVLTRAGKTRPIVWIGKGRVLATRGRRTAATPVIVRKGALARDVPRRDLRVTKAHALYFGGALIPVEFLVNHRSILWDDHAQEVELFHIELATHDILLADGALAESYRDDGNRWLFQNANSGWHLPAQEPCAPILTGGAFVDGVWRRLLDRAGPRPGLVLTDDPDLHLRIGDERHDVCARHGLAYIFRLNAPRQDVRIISSSAVPEELGTTRDPRMLGVALRQIVLRQDTKFKVLEAENPLLRDGFHPFEPSGKLCWTNGDATLPAVLFDEFSGPIELVLHLACITQYPARGAAAAA